MKFSILNESLTNCKSPEELLDYMTNNIKYCEFDILKSPLEVVDTKCGSCHDQVIFELQELDNMGLNPKALFIMEYDSESYQGGQTHSLVYYIKNNKYYWFENAWEDERGIHEYDSFDDLKDDIINKFNAQMDSIEIVDFGTHISGEDLQELVDKVFNE